MKVIDGTEIKKNESRDIHSDLNHFVLVRLSRKFYSLLERVNGVRFGAKEMELLDGSRHLIRSIPFANRRNISPS